MQESTSGSSLLSGGALPSWALFLVPVAVSAVVIVSTSAAVLSADPDPVDRNLAPSFDGQAHASIEEPREAPAYQAANDEPTSPRSQRSTRSGTARRRGFSPVLADGGSEIPPPAEASATSDPEEDDDDIYDDMSDADDPRKPITPERRQEIIERMKANEDKVPFLRGFSRVIDRVRSRKAGDGASAPGADSESNASGDNSTEQNSPQDAPHQQGMAGAGNRR